MADDVREADSLDIRKSGKRAPWIAKPISAGGRLVPRKGEAWEGWTDRPLGTAALARSRLSHACVGTASRILIPHEGGSGQRVPKGVEVVYTSLEVA